MNDAWTINDNSRSMNYKYIMTINDTYSHQNDPRAWSITH
jgi:hypothetical protein